MVSTARPIMTDQQTYDLFVNLAEQVKLPLVQIMHAAELLRRDTQNPQLETISLAGQTAVRLIDGYLLSVQLQRENQLELEPVSVSSLMYDTAEALRPAAAAAGVSVELEVAGRYGPVLSHGRALASALINIGHSFIEAASVEEKPAQRVVKLAVRRISSGISAGVFSPRPALSGELLVRARSMQGVSHQPLPGFVSDAAAGIFVADQLLSRIEAPMRAARFKDSNGLAATLLPSRQLSLV